MATYISHNGNREVWDEKPVGYVTEDEWRNNHPELFRPDSDAVWNGAKWEVPFAILVERKKAEIATARYNAEIAGVTINGVSIKTDRETQAVLTAACLQAYIDSGYSLNWKTGDGTFVSLPAEQIMAFGTAVRAHVQSCFDHEAELLPLIESAETEAELDSIKWGD